VRSGSTAAAVRPNPSLKRSAKAGRCRPLSSNVSIKKKGVFMAKSIIVAILLIAVVTLLCSADQLAWNRRPI